MTTELTPDQESLWERGYLISMIGLILFPLSICFVFFMTVAIEQHTMWTILIYVPFVAALFLINLGWTMRHEAIRGHELTEEEAMEARIARIEEQLKTTGVDKKELE